MRRRRRTSQAGQVVVITALMATVILGGMALTVDLSLHTYNQRTLQNVADAAALAGATDLQRIPTATQQQTGVTDALLVIQKNQSFPAGWAGGSSATTCTTGSISGYCETVSYLNYTVKISTPPQTSKAITNITANDFEVEMSVNVSNNFGAFVGASTSTVGAHAVAYHSGPPSPYDYTFFSLTQVDSGNQPEAITGDAYVGAGYVGSSGSKSGLCVSELPGPEPASDTETPSDAGRAADDDVDDQGHVTFSSLPPTAHPGVNGDPIYTSNACANAQIATQTLQSTGTTGTAANCAPGATPQLDSGGLQCVQSPPPLPPIILPAPNQPTPLGTGVALTCGGVVNSSTMPGIYAVPAGCTVDLNFSTGDIQCIDLVLGTGSTVNVVDKGSQDYMTSWDFDPTTDSIAVNALNAIKVLNPTVTPWVQCPGAKTGSLPDTSPSQIDNCVICAPPSTVSCTITSCPTALQNTSKGRAGTNPDTLFIGTIYLAGQQIYFNSNESMEDVGSIYCGYWNVSSGNHPNPVVQHDNNATDLRIEILRLVE